MQRVVAELCRDGATNAQIAARLGVTEDTVKSQLRVAMGATGAETRTALALAVARGELRVLASSKPPEPLPACALTSAFGTCDLRMGHDGAHAENCGKGSWFAWAGLRLPLGYGTFRAGQFVPETAPSLTENVGGTR